MVRPWDFPLEEIGYSGLEILAPNLSPKHVRSSLFAAVRFRPRAPGTSRDQQG